jgi:hypothetical protein
MFKFSETQANERLADMQAKFPDAIEKSRAEKAASIIQTDAIQPTRRGGAYTVRSKTRDEVYLVDTNAHTCTCPDATNGHVCKHRIAVGLLLNGLDYIGANNQAQVRKLDLQRAKHLALKDLDRIEKNYARECDRFDYCTIEELQRIRTEITPLFDELRAKAAEIHAMYTELAQLTDYIQTINPLLTWAGAGN